MKTARTIAAICLLAILATGCATAGNRRPFNLSECEGIAERTTGGKVLEAWFETRWNEDGTSYRVCKLTVLNLGKASSLLVDPLSGQASREEDPDLVTGQVEAD